MPLLGPIGAVSTHHNRDTESLLFAVEVMGDDLSFYPRFKEIIAVSVGQFRVAARPKSPRR